MSHVESTDLYEEGAPIDADTAEWEKIRANQFRLQDFITAVRKHPPLLEFLGFEGLEVDIAFHSLHPTSEGTVRIEDLERYLQAHDKCHIDGLLKWLNKYWDQDHILTEMRDELKGELQEIVAHLKEQLSHNQDVLDNLDVRDGDVVDGQENFNLLLESDIVLKASPRRQPM